jgi:hypothetical protein
MTSGAITQANFEETLKKYAIFKLLYDQSAAEEEVSNPLDDTDGNP